MHHSLQSLCVMKLGIISEDTEDSEDSVLGSAVPPVLLTLFRLVIECRTSSALQIHTGRIALQFGCDKSSSSQFTCPVLLTADGATVEPGD